MKSLDYVASILILILIAITAVTLIAPLIVWKTNIVLSGSMEPAISSGDLIVTAPAAAADIRTGDIITFASPNGFTCHRVTGIDQSPLRFTTRGDANEDADRLRVSADQVTGKVVLRVPLVGYVSTMIRTPAGLIFTIVIPGLLIVGLEMKRLLWDRA